MNLDFLEIGTCNFDTLIQKATDTTYGISVVPLSYYLNQLPSPKNVIKVNSAISFDNIESEIEIFYIPENIIIENNLPKSLTGCNSLSTYHLKHIELNLQKYVQIEKIKQIPIGKLWTDYRIETINYLKIDTEGGDTYILKHLYNYLNLKDKNYYPKKIRFESNRLSATESVDEIIELYKSIGYNLLKRKADTIMELR